MNKYYFLLAVVIVISINVSCKKSKETESKNVEVVTLKEIPEVEETTVATKQNPIDFIPKSYIAFDTIYGDLNKDGLEDCALIIKGTDKSKVITDEYRGTLDRNRRGIIVLLNKKAGYELFLKNEDCFSSENEEGGVYYAPELDVEITKGKLFVAYRHGRYGYWEYMFRIQDNDLTLIGYDASSNNGPVVNIETSINFLTGKKITNVNTNESADSGEEVFEKKESKINRTKLIKLSEIKDFDELRFFDE